MTNIQIIRKSSRYKSWNGLGNPPPFLTQLVYDFMYPNESDPNPSPEIRKDIREFLHILKEEDYNK